MSPTSTAGTPPRKSIWSEREIACMCSSFEWTTSSAWIAPYCGPVRRKACCTYWMRAAKLLGEVVVQFVDELGLRQLARRWRDRVPGRGALG